MPAVSPQLLAPALPAPAVSSDSSDSPRPPGLRLARRAAAWLVVACVLVWVGVFFQRRAALRIENHLARAIELPFPPAARPAVSRDGRLFFAGPEQHLFALERTGQLAWHKQLMGPARGAPVLLGSERLLVPGERELYVYSLGGEQLFGIRGEDISGARLAPAPQGARVWILSDSGTLSSIDAIDGSGQARARAETKLVHPRGLLALADGRVLALGSRADGVGELHLYAPDAALLHTVALDATPCGLGPSALPGELAVVSLGSRIAVVDAQGALAASPSLPGHARSAPLRTPDGALAVRVAVAGHDQLCRLDGAVTCVPLGLESGDGCTEAPARSPDGRIYAPFTAPGGLWPDYAGVLALGPGGLAYRQALPGDAAQIELTHAPGGPLLLTQAHQRYVWEVETERAAP